MCNKELKNETSQPLLWKQTEKKENSNSLRYFCIGIIQILNITYNKFLRKKSSMSSNLVHFEKKEFC